MKKKQASFSHYEDEKGNTFRVREGEIERAREQGAQGKLKPRYNRNIGRRR